MTRIVFSFLYGETEVEGRRLIGEKSGMGDLRGVSKDVLGGIAMEIGLIDSNTRRRFRGVAEQ